MVDRRGSKAPSLPKMNPQEMSEAAPRPVLLKEVVRKYFINLIYLSTFLAILSHKQTYKGGHF